MAEQGDVQCRVNPSSAVPISAVFVIRDASCVLLLSISARIAAAVGGVPVLEMSGTGKRKGLRERKPGL